MFSKECASIPPIFTNFRRNLPVFKKGVRLNFTDFHKFSSKLASFQKRSAPKFHKKKSSTMVYFQIRNALQFHEFSSKMVNFQIRSEGCRVGPCRSVGRSPIRFFAPILNNALALRASQKELERIKNLKLQGPRFRRTEK